MAETILQAVERARHVRVFVHPDYDDHIEWLTAPCSKALARTIVGRAPADAKPTASWHGNLVLTLLPQATDGRIEEE